MKEALAIKKVAVVMMSRNGGANYRKMLRRPLLQ